jgi:hypothetical protein
VQLNGEVLDLLGEFDPVTNFRFTPLCAGRYFVSAYCNFTNTGSGFTTGINCFIFKTGVQNMIGSPGSGATTNVPVTSTVSGAVYLNVGDYLELFATSTIAANNTVGIGSSMTIVRID